MNYRLKKSTLTILAVIAALGVVAFAFSENIKQFVFQKLTDDMFVSQDNDSFEIGPDIGSDFPVINASYKGQTLNQLDPLLGNKGTVFLASRSVDWCPYCMRQLVELQSHKAAFDEAELNLVVMTYDTPAQQKTFAQKHSISIPMLSDINASTFKTLGILHADYGEDDNNYGLPYPGSIVIDAEGKIVGKIFIEAYSTRVDAKSTLSYALSQLAD